MRVACFHNWSVVGSAVGHALIDVAEDELLLIGAATDPGSVDTELVDHADRSGARCGMAVDVASDAFVGDLAAFAPDVVVVATFPVLLPARVLALPGRGCFNVHASLLPAYRGAMPEFWAIRNGEDHTGITVHRMSERFDAGDIVARAVVAVDPRETLRSLGDKLAAAAAPLVVDWLGRVRGGEPLDGVVQDEHLVTRAPAPTPLDLEIRWSEAAPSIERLVRACDDWFGASTVLRGRPLVVRKARAVAEGTALGAGELCFDARASALRVGTGEGTLVIEQLELAGRRLDAEAFAAEVGLGDRERFTSSTGSSP